MFHPCWHIFTLIWSLIKKKWKWQMQDFKNLLAPVVVRTRLSWLWRIWLVTKDVITWHMNITRWVKKWFLKYPTVKSQISFTLVNKIVLIQVTGRGTITKDDNDNVLKCNITTAVNTVWHHDFISLRFHTVKWYIEISTFKHLCCTYLGQAWCF